MDTDRNLRFGLRALALGLIDSDQLADAGRQWLLHPETSVADILESRGWITRSDRAAIEETVLQGQTPVDADAATVTAAGPEEEIPDLLYAAAFPDSATTLRTSSANFGNGAATRQFGPRYRRVLFHAEGGIGIVWRAIDDHLGREVALKVLRPEHAGNVLVEKRFREEARITARLEHPNIVPMHDLPTDAEQPFYTMRFLRGDTLKTAVMNHHLGKTDGATPTLDFRGLLDRFISICNAIAFAHEQRIIHRDLKGSNILFGSFGEVAVVDWGLARELDSKEDPLGRPSIEMDLLPPEMTRTMEGYPIGTAQYMPPEQAIGSRESIGPRSDIFGLGAVLYLILTGHPPYEGGSHAELILKARNHDFRIPSELQPNTPKGLESICLKAMAMNIDDRYKTATELAEDVRRWMADEAVEAHPDEAPAKVARWARKNQPVVAGGVMLLLASTVGLALGAWRVRVESIKVEKANEVITANLGSSINALSGMLDLIVTDLPQIHDPKIDNIRVKATQLATGFATDLVDRNSHVSALRGPLGNLLRETAKLDSLTGRLPQAETSIRQAIETLDTADPGLKVTLIERDLLAEYRRELADILLQQGKANDAEQAAREARRAAESDRRLFPSNGDAVRTDARARMVAADVASVRSQPVEAERLYREAIDMFEKLNREGDVGSYDRLSITVAAIGRGVALRDLKREVEADKVLTDARGKAIAMIQDNSFVDDARNFVSICDLELARARAGKAAQAETLNSLNTAIVNIEKLVKDRPLLVAIRIELAYARNIRGETPGSPQPEEDFKQALELCNQALNEAPAGAATRAIRARAKAGLAGIAIAKNQRERARDLTGQARVDLEELRKLNPDDAESREVTKLLNALDERMK
jgi:serine/threonine protein kinase